MIYTVCQVWTEFGKLPNCGEKQITPHLRVLLGGGNKVIKIKWGRTPGVFAFYLTNSLARFQNTKLSSFQKTIGNFIFILGACHSLWLSLSHIHMFSKYHSLNLTRNNLLRASQGPVTSVCIMTDNEASTHHPYLHQESKNSATEHICNLLKN